MRTNDGTAFYTADDLPYLVQHQELSLLLFLAAGFIVGALSLLIPKVRSAVNKSYYVPFLIAMGVAVAVGAVTVRAGEDTVRKDATAAAGEAMNAQAATASYGTMGKGVPKTFTFLIEGKKVQCVTVKNFDEDAWSLACG